MLLWWAKVTPVYSKEFVSKGKAPLVTGDSEGVSRQSRPATSPMSPAALADPLANPQSEYSAQSWRAAAYRCGEKPLAPSQPAPQASPQPAHSQSTASPSSPSRPAGSGTCASRSVAVCRHGGLDTVGTRPGAGRGGRARASMGARPLVKGLSATAGRQALCRAPTHTPYPRPGTPALETKAVT